MDSSRGSQSIAHVVHVLLQILKGSKNYTTKVDVYSFAIILWEMVSKDMPFKDVKFNYEITDLVVQGMLVLLLGYVAYSCFVGKRPEIQQSCPKVLKGMIESAWQTDDTKRPEFLELVQQLEKLSSEH